MTVNLNQEKIIFINCYILPIKTEHRIKLWNNMCKSLPSYLNKMIYTRGQLHPPKGWSFLAEIYMKI